MRTQIVDGKLFRRQTHRLWSAGQPSRITSVFHKRITFCMRCKVIKVLESATSTTAPVDRAPGLRLVSYVFCVRYSEVQGVSHCCSCMWGTGQTSYKCSFPVTSHGSVEKCHSNLKNIGKAEMLNACIASKVCDGFLYWLSCEVWNLESAVVTWISCSLSRRSTWTAAVSCAVKRSCLLALTRQAATGFCWWTWHRGFPNPSSRMNFWFLWCFFQLRFMLQSYANTEAVRWWVATYPTVIACGKRCIALCWIDINRS